MRNVELAGKFYRCVDDDNNVLANIDRYPSAQNLGCLPPNTWANPSYHFDDITIAMKTLFSVWTIGGWADVMQASMDTTSIDFAPQRNASAGMALYYVAFLLFVAYMMRSLFIAVLVDFFAQSSGSALTTKTQKNWQQMKMVTSRMKPKYKQPEGPWLCVSLHRRLNCFAISNDPKFLKVVDASIVIAVCIELLPSDLWPVAIKALFSEIQRLILLLWTLEAAVKIPAVTFLAYMRTNKLDLFILIILWIVGVKQTIYLYGSEDLRSSVRFLDALDALLFLRVLRLTKLLTRCDECLPVSLRRCTRNAITS